MWDLIVSVPDHCLSFYLSPAVFEKKISTFIQWAVCKHSNLTTLDHYLDDFWFADKHSTD